MACRFAKRTLLTVYGCCRQAARSLDNALTFPTIWTGLLAFYDETKRQKIRELAVMLNAAAPGVANAPSRRALYRNEFRTFFSALLYLACNRLKKSWALSSAEAAFIASSLERLLEMLGQQQPPSADAFIDLRMDFSACELIIEHKLIGIPEMRLARNIEFFDPRTDVDHPRREERSLQSPT